MAQYNLINFASLDSTNTYAGKNISTLSDKDVILAEIQTAGRGRFDRQWISDVPGNIYASIVLKPTGDYTKLPLSCMTHYTALTICRTLEEYGITPKIKWPNDVKVDGAKISGILSRTMFTGMNFNGLVVGVGINLNLSEDHLSQISQKATSMNLVLGKDVNRYEFLNKFLDKFFQDYDEFLQKGFVLIKNSYIERCSSLNCQLTVHTISGDVQGFAKGISDCGMLQLETSHGLEEICEGES